MHICIDTCSYIYSRDAGYGSAWFMYLQWRLKSTERGPMYIA